MARREGSLRVEVPKPGEDKPRFGRVAIITLAGFAIGIAWPRLAGMKLVPSVPEESNAAAEAPAGDSAEPPSAPPPALGKAAPAAEEPEAPPAKVERLKVSDPKITSCRD